MMTVTYKNTSMYRNTKLNDNFLEIYQPPIVPNFENVKEFTITQKYNKRPDLLAFDLYGTSSLWWIFVIYNRGLIRDPLFDFVSGITILIPKSINDIGL
jgi:hypothetical protein